MGDAGTAVGGESSTSDRKKLSKREAEADYRFSSARSRCRRLRRRCTIEKEGALVLRFAKFSLLYPPAPASRRGRGEGDGTEANLRCHASRGACPSSFIARPTDADEQEL